ncbi:restriction endonuclease subunit S [Leptolyngbya sp. PCC 6406]|uniref:restriction endonuclease subunit S n=1 Tax=Leptolyngbya sp. PCC 6406 TaxID=1173264 RepID=UPI0002AC0365|nr:restriction endonuclease subunit S [Leptolyngbya sp. PCC 6406]
MKTIKINDGLQKIIDYRGKTPPKSADGITLISAANIKSGTLDFSRREFISKEDYANWTTRGFTKPGDVLFTTEAPTAEVAFYPEEGIYQISRRVIALRTDEKVLHNLYLFYLLQSPPVKQRMLSANRGSTVPRLLKTDITQFTIKVPNYSQQKETAKTLACLDRKIENLRKQNETLEQIAQTLFKHWFVDFEFPYDPSASSGQRFAQGRPYKSSGGEMVPSELGAIPAGWRVGKLRELIEVNPREAIKKGNDVKYVDMKSLSTSSMEITGYIIRKFNSGSKFRNGDTLLARITPCLENGKTAFVNLLDSDEVAYGSTEFIVMRAKSSCCPEYVYCLSRSENFRDYAIKNMTGSSGRQRVPNDQVEDYELAISELTTFQLFHNVCQPLFLKIESNQRQIQTLTQTRDALLPKLMSGQLRIQEG